MAGALEVSKSDFPGSAKTDPVVILYVCTSGGGEAGASQGGPLHFHVVRSYFYIQSLFLRSFFNPLFQANTRVQTK